jgi:UDP-N-acetylglucosamine transferase subunit ALG13
MIFVSLGTQPNQFSRLLKELEELIKIYNIQDEIIVQIGHTKYESKLFKAYDFMDSSIFEEFMDKADVIISHAGSGSLFSAIKRGKKIIAVARLEKYKEHQDNHQTELARKLSQEGYLINGTWSLIEAWKKLDDFIPKKFDFSNSVATNIKKYIDSLD